MICLCKIQAQQQALLLLHNQCAGSISWKILHASCSWNKLPCIYIQIPRSIWYEVATISRLLNITGLFCKRAISKRLYFAKETCTFKEPTNRSHPIHRSICVCVFACVCVFVRRYLGVSPLYNQVDRYSRYLALSLFCIYRYQILRGVCSICQILSHIRRGRREYSLFYRALLQKRPTILRSLPIVATP